MYFVILVILGLFFTDASVKAEYSIPKEDLIQLWKLKEASDILQENGIDFDASLFSAKVTPRISEEDVSFYTYTSSDDEGTQIEMTDVSKLTDFNASNPTVIITHGWRNNYQSPVVTEVKSAYFTKNQNYNIFAVDWHSYARKSYFKALAVVPNVGKYIGDFLNSLYTTYNYSLSQVTLLGHSLGAHVSGVAGKETNGSVGLIIGLDPAGPFYYEYTVDRRLAKGDAQFIEVIHTNAQFLGANFDLGDSDFWPNGGYRQPQCGEDLFGTCSHSLSYAYFVESIERNDFLGKQCIDYANFKAGNCTTNDVAQMGGEYVDTGSSGTYYLKTNQTYPYGLGQDGVTY